MNVNGILIDNLNKEKKLRHLAVFVYIKSFYSNSCIFDYSQDRLAAKSKLSKSSIRKYINYYLKNGWCEIHKGNLVFKKLKSIRKEKKLVLYKVTGKTIKEITESLLLCLLKHNANQAKWYSNLRQDLDIGRKVLTNRMLKKYPDLLRGDYNGEIDSSGRFKVSIKKIAEWFNKKSAASAHKIMNELYVSGKVLKYIGGYTALHKAKEASRYISNYSPNSFISKSGKMVIVHCNSYVFN